MTPNSPSVRLEYGMTPGGMTLPYLTIELFPGGGVFDEILYTYHWETFSKILPLGTVQKTLLGSGGFLFSLAKSGCPPLRIGRIWAPPLVELAEPECRPAPPPSDKWGNQGTTLKASTHPVVSSERFLNVKTILVMGLQIMKTTTLNGDKYQ